ncbi:hypothetical protein N431DRAFT_513334 [Stipitochalara longipes BDJ]|nr:hypothetical protein N431DRAFT_513334 [Stipitochalara longipes BDJ]
MTQSPSTKAISLTRHIFAPGGPILFFQNDESAQPISGGTGSININLFVDIAQELDAMRIYLEHRQRDRDAVIVMKHIKTTVPGAEESNIIVTGNSYGGFLGTTFRLRAPDVFYGSITSSPGLTGLGPYPNNTLKFAYHDWLNNVWFDISDAAANKIKHAVRAFKNLSQKCDCSSVPGFNFCGPQPNATSLASLYEDLIQHFNFMTQYNSGIKTIYPANVVQFVANLTLAAASDGAVARIPFDIALGSYTPNQTTQCLDWQNLNITSNIRSDVGAAWQFWRETCSLKRIRLGGSNAAELGVGRRPIQRHTEASNPIYIFPEGLRPGVDAARVARQQAIKGWLGMNVGELGITGNFAKRDISQKRTPTRQKGTTTAGAPENNYFDLASLAKVIAALCTHDPEEREKLLQSATPGQNVETLASSVDEKHQDANRDNRIQELESQVEGLRNKVTNLIENTKKPPQFAP